MTNSAKSHQIINISKHHEKKEETNVCNIRIDFLHHPVVYSASSPLSLSEHCVLAV